MFKVETRQISGLNIIFSRKNEIRIGSAKNVRYD